MSAPAASARAGLLLIVLEGGLCIELQTLRRVGWKAFAIAISGTMLPVLGSVLILPAFGDAQNCGARLTAGAPTGRPRRSSAITVGS